MGLDFVRHYPVAQAVFDEASEVLGMDMQALMEDEDRLQLTEFAQPAILTTEIAMYRSLQEQYKLEPEVFGGHSLGEYSALVAAGVIPFRVAVKAVHLRGQMMQSASPAGIGGMVALISDELPLGAIEAISKENDIDIANDNSPAQLVLSGEKSRLEQVMDRLRDLFHGKEFRTVALEVSAPFHSRHMATMEKSFRDFLESAKGQFSTTNLSRVVSNVSGKFHTPDLDKLIDLLTRQISGRVNWRHNMQELVSRASGVLEIGPGRPLGGFFKTMLVSVASVIDLRSAQRAFEPKPGN